ncbi:MAG: PilZ domain-containing protein [Mariprofundaceae bacterium]
MAIEQRSEERHVARDMSNGELYHPGSGLYLKVEQVRDVSSRGIGLKVDSFLDQGEKIRLGFKRGRTHVQMYGYVAWCAPVEEASPDDAVALFMMGIALQF